MTNEEFHQLTKDYVSAHKAYTEFQGTFFTETVDGVVVNEATDVLSEENWEKLRSLIKTMNDLQDRWLNALGEKRKK